MRKILRSSRATDRYLKKLPSMYLVGCWADYGIQSFPFSGKYRTLNGIDYPLVWQYDDCNGTSDSWYLRPIYSVTSGLILTWTQNERTAKNIVDAFKAECAWKNSQLPNHVKE